MSRKAKQRRNVMSDEGTKQNEQTKAKKSIIKNPVVIAAIIGAATTIIVALINAYSVRSIKVYLIDKETRQGISGDVFIDAEKNGVLSVPDKPADIKVRKGDRFIRAENDHYITELKPIARVAKTLTIEMEKIAVAATGPTPLSFAGHRPWSSEITIREGASSNEIIVSGTFEDAAGFFITGLPSALRGRTLVLYFSNTGASRFSRSRMVKVEYNRDDILLIPSNAALVSGGEYLAGEDTPPDSGIEFPLPDGFAGRLNFTFYSATLDDLIIKAFYQ
jgi:hypothetical protein